MKVFIGIDPGLNHIAAAGISLDGSLSFHILEEVNAGERTAGGYVAAALKVYEQLSPYIEDSAVAVEQMVHIDKWRKRKNSDPNDLISLAYLSGAILDKLVEADRVTLVTPMTWKGNTPKKVMQNRLERDYGVELEREYGSTLAHNVYDAIGIAKWARENLS